MRTFIATTAVLLAATGIAGAQDLRRTDTDGDGRLSRAEATAAAQGRFAALDENADGFVSELEREAAKADARERRAARQAERESAGEGRRGHGRRGQQGAAGDRWERLDTNDDGVVSETEAVSQALARFDRLDADADGFVTEDEARAAKRERRAERGSRSSQRRGD